MGVSRIRPIRLVRSLAAVEPPTYELRDAELLNDILFIRVQFTGGCTQHDFELLGSSSGSRTDSLPVAELTLLHDARGDACKALVQEELRFDLTPLRRLWARKVGRGALLPLHISGQRLLYRL